MRHVARVLFLTGAATLNFYGSGIPDCSPGGGGPVQTTVLSGPGSDFQGYIIAVCKFQYAHGFGFIGDLGARNLAQGYLQRIIPFDTGAGANCPAAH